MNSVLVDLGDGHTDFISIWLPLSYMFGFVNKVNIQGYIYVKGL